MKKDRIQAIQLRQEGKSYSEINKILGTPKSTLSIWLQKIAASEKIKQTNILKAKKIWANNIIQYNKKRAAEKNDAAKNLQLISKKEISLLTKLELKLIGIALYWAEGYKRTKWSPMFCNSDPAMVKIMMRFFREICEVPENRFRPQVQTHPHASQEEAEKYWGNVAKLDRKFFVNPLVQLSSSSKQKRPINRLPFGTFRIRIADSRVINKLKGWIEGIGQSAY